jgi:hypothetical protein
VSLKNGRLTIQANNSDLTQILRDVAHVSGMTIDGINKSARVFGQYGPGDPSDVLTDLLAGSGYNFVIVGDRADGAPRELLLTAKNSNAPVPTPSNPPPAVVAAPAPPEASAAPDDHDSPEQPVPEVNGDDPNAPTPDQSPPLTDPQVSPDGASGP